VRWPGGRQGLELKWVLTRPVDSINQWQLHAFFRFVKLHRCKTESCYAREEGVPPKMNGFQAKTLRTALGAPDMANVSSVCMIHN